MLAVRLKVFCSIWFNIKAILTLEYTVVSFPEASLLDQTDIRHNQRSGSSKADM